MTIGVDGVWREFGGWRCLLTGCQRMWSNAAQSTSSLTANLLIRVGESERGVARWRQYYNVSRLIVMRVNIELGYAL